MVGNTAFGGIVQEQDKKPVSSNKSADNTYTINTSDGNQRIMISVIV